MGFGAAGLIGAGIGGLGKIGFGIFQNAQANKIHPQYNPYQTSPYAKQELGLANQFLNGRMAGAGDQEKNILASGANYNAAVQRNATDSSQALSLAGLGMGKTNDAFNQLGIQEQQNKQQMLQNENHALEGMTSEHDKQFQDMWQKYLMDTQQKAETRNSAWQNIFSGFGDLTGGALQLGQQKQQQNNFQAIGSENMFG